MDGTPNKRFSTGRIGKEPADTTSRVWTAIFCRTDGGQALDRSKPITGIRFDRASGNLLVKAMSAFHRAWRGSYRLLRPCARYVLIAVIFFSGLELVLWAFGLFEPERLLLKMDYDGRRYATTNRDYAERFFQRAGMPTPQPLWVPVEKDPDVKRVVLLGESAAAGFPMMGYNLARLVNIIWQERFPEQPVEVVNLSVVAINSHVLRLFAREAMVLNPDLFVLYAGHNEVIGPFGPASRFGRMRGIGSLARLVDALRNTRTGRAADALAQHFSERVMGWDERIWKGLDEFQGVSIAHDDPALDGMLHHVEANFREIIERALSREAKVLVCVPAVNLNDWPPLDSEPAAYGPHEVLAAQEAGNLAGLRSARPVYEAAQLREAQGDMKRAWPLYRLAGDLDLIRIRADSRIRNLQRRIAGNAEEHVGLVDADRWLHEKNPTFSGDGEFFLEHVHLTFAGRVAVAALIVDGMAALWHVEVPDSPDRDPETWWSRFPALYEIARERTLFTPYDETEMWRRTGDLLSMDIFATSPGVTDRMRAIEERIRHMRSRTQEEWDATRLAEVYERASEKNAEDPLLHFTAGRLFGEMHSFQLGRKTFERGLALQPNHGIGRLNLARLEFMAGDTLRAREILYELDRFDQHVSGRALLEATLSWHEGMPKQAIRDLQRHLTESPRDIPAWEQLILLQEQTGKAEDAARSRARLMELRP